jgi:hypothetical protein
MGTSEHPVGPTDDQRNALRRLIGGGAAPARKAMHARGLLEADRGLGDSAIAAALEVHPTCRGAPGPPGFRRAARR